MSQTAQDLAPQPVSVQTMHRLSSIHQHHVDCNEAKGTASTKMGETVGMEQNQKDVCVEKMKDQNQALLSRHNVFLVKLTQVDMGLHRFPSIILKSGGRLRGHTGSTLRACTGVSDCGV